MAGLDWFEADVDFPDDPKVKALASRLREPLADAYVFRLYAYCYKYARDRFDPAVAADVIEDACRWRGRRGVLFDALFAVEVLERDAGKVVVHGVADRLGPHLAKRVADTERQRRRRDKVAASIGQPPPVVRDVTRDTPVSHGGTETETGTETKQAIPLARPLPITGAGGRRVKVCLGPKGTLFVASCAKGLGHGLVPLASSDDAEALEKRVDAHGGPDAAREYIAAACRRRDDFDPQSVKLLLDMLGDPLAPEAA